MGLEFFADGLFDSLVEGVEGDEGSYYVEDYLFGHFEGIDVGDAGDSVILMVGESSDSR